MKAKRLVLAGVAVAIALASRQGIAAQRNHGGSGGIKHVLLLSIDGMHAIDFYNCVHGIAGANGGSPYCPNLAALSQTAINYVNVTSSKPSDSFPGLAALITGGSPRTHGIYYDIAYDRSLDPPAETTLSGLFGAPGLCTPFAAPSGTTTDNDQGIDINDNLLNGGAPPVAGDPYDGGVASIEPLRLERDPASGCAVVWPWNFIRTNTIFGVAHDAGLYTAWIDKRPSYAFVNGPGPLPDRVNDLFAPEIASTVVPLPGVNTLPSGGVSCATVRDPTQPSGWDSSFQNIQCYDGLRLNALLNEIAGKTHNGKPAVVPAVFGMNLHSVYVGQSVNESPVGVGGYLNAAGLPSPELLGEIEYVDTAIGFIVTALEEAGIYNDTLLIITAKHGESPIDTAQYVADGTNTPATLLAEKSLIPFSESPLNTTGVGATEDDVSVIWLKKGASVADAVEVLDQNAGPIGLGEIYYGPSVALNFNVGGLGPDEDPRTPDIIVTPNVGVTYSSSTAMIGDHGGFAHDDNNVILLVENPHFTAQTVSAGVTTAQVAPTIVGALGLDPALLDAVRLEGTQVLLEVGAQLGK